MASPPTASLSNRPSPDPREYERRNELGLHVGRSACRCEHWPIRAEVSRPNDDLRDPLPALLLFVQESERQSAAALASSATPFSHARSKAPAVSASRHCATRVSALARLPGRQPRRSARGWRRRQPSRVVAFVGCRGAARSTTSSRQYAIVHGSSISRRERGGSRGNERAPRPEPLGLSSSSRGCRADGEIWLAVVLSVQRDALLHRPSPLSISPATSSAMPRLPSASARSRLTLLAACSRRRREAS